LPDFAKARWVMSFLPTLYARLASALNPWRPYNVGSDLVDTVQEVVDFVYPGSGYEVKLGDKIYTMRTYFRRESISIVAAYFKGDTYAGNRKAISEYAKWAGRGDGPSVFGIPTPIDCTVAEDHPDYIPLDNLFESKFVIELMSPFLKLCEGSAHDYGRPVGAFCMAAAGVECAFRMYDSGERRDVGQFSQEKVGEMVDDYIFNAKKFS
ncbi:hypothetical protein BJV74DRAFT_713691, partial [Russula compacta]